MDFPMPDLLVSTTLLRGPERKARRYSRPIYDNPNEFIFISIGTGLGNMARNVTTTSIVTERHAAPFVKPMVEMISVDLRTREKEGKALAIMRHLLAIALETQDAHEKLSQVHSKANYYRLDPALGLAEVNLCDCFHRDKDERAVNE